VAAQLLEALARIHDFGVAHGDIHPLNVRLSGGDFARIQNVGVGRASLADPWEDDPKLLAMQSYLAPERGAATLPGAAGDIYGVGALVYHMMTGRLPVEADNVAELRSQLSDPASDPTRALPDMPEPLKEWMGMLMNRDTTLRIDNAHHALVDLRSRAQECGIVIPKASSPEVAPGILALDGDFLRWNRFREVFEQMVALGYPHGAPPATSEALLTLIGRVSQLDDIAKNARYQYGLLEEVEQRSREGRQHIAEQMEALNESGSQLRIDRHPLRIAAARHAEKLTSYPEEMRSLHAQVITWEGRSGFMEPYPQLAAAYRAAADFLDKWHGLRQAELSCRAEVSQHDEELARMTEEITQLRESLRVHESNSGAERAACVHALAELGTQADGLHMALMHLAARFSAPLRSKPELGVCFQQLQQAQ
jgi:serine/threonine-protein kinase